MNSEVCGSRSHEIKSWERKTSVLWLTLTYWSLDRLGFVGSKHPSIKSMHRYKFNFCFSPAKLLLTESLTLITIPNLITVCITYLGTIAFNARAHKHTSTDAIFSPINIPSNLDYNHKLSIWAISCLPQCQWYSSRTRIHGFFWLIGNRNETKPSTWTIPSIECIVMDAHVVKWRLLL